MAAGVTLSAQNLVPRSRLKCSGVIFFLPVSAMLALARCLIHKKIRWRNKTYLLDRKGQVKQVVELVEPLAS